MRLKPGCGCLVLILGVLNLLLVSLTAYGLIRGTMNRSLLTIVMLLIFGSDACICFLVGLAAIRGGRKAATASGDTAEEAEGYEADDADEGEER